MKQTELQETLARAGVPELGQDRLLRVFAQALQDDAAEVLDLLGPYLREWPVWDYRHYLGHNESTVRAVAGEVREMLARLTAGTLRGHLPLLYAPAPFEGRVYLPAWEEVYVPLLRESPALRDWPCDAMPAALGALEQHKLAMRDPEVPVLLEVRPPALLLLRTQAQRAMKPAGKAALREAWLRMMDGVADALVELGDTAEEEHNVLAAQMLRERLRPELLKAAEENVKRRRFPLKLIRVLFLEDQGQALTAREMRFARSCLGQFHPDPPRKPSVAPEALWALRKILVKEQARAVREPADPHKPGDPEGPRQAASLIVRVRKSRSERPRREDPDTDLSQVGLIRQQSWALTCYADLLRERLRNSPRDDPRRAEARRVLEIYTMAHNLLRENGGGDPSETTRAWDELGRFCLEEALGEEFRETLRDRGKTLRGQQSRDRHAALELRTVRLLLAYHQLELDVPSAGREAQDLLEALRQGQVAGKQDDPSLERLEQLLWGLLELHGPGANLEVLEKVVPLVLNPVDTDQELMAERQPALFHSRAVRHSLLKQSVGRAIEISRFFLADHLLAALLGSTAETGKAGVADGRAKDQELFRARWFRGLEAANPEKCAEARREQARRLVPQMVLSGIDLFWSDAVDLALEHWLCALQELRGEGGPETRQGQDALLLRIARLQLVEPGRREQLARGVARALYEEEATARARLERVLHPMDYFAME
jgi:hypothetical protein